MARPDGDMKHARYSAIAYERPGPVSDMFVPHRVRISLAVAPPRRISKFVSTLLLLVAVPALLHQGGTFSYFSDTEASTDNTFAAGQLDFTVSSDHSSATLIAGQTDEIFVITVTPGAGSLPFRYKVSGTEAGSPPFCAATTAFGRAPLLFSGSAASISTGDTDSLVPWSLILTLLAGAPDVVEGQVCTLDLTFQGYQDGGVAGTEYYDTEHVILTLTADPPADLPVIAPQSALGAYDPTQDSTNISNDPPPLEDATTTTTTLETESVTEQENVAEVDQQADESTVTESNIEPPQPDTLQD